MTPDIIKRMDHMLALVRAEVIRAIDKHPLPFHSAHEGYAVILEEVEELWEEIKNDGGRDIPARLEALQIAAMGVRYLIDLSPERIFDS